MEFIAEYADAVCVEAEDAVKFARGMKTRLLEGNADVPAMMRLLAEADDCLVQFNRLAKSYTR